MNLEEIYDELNECIRIKNIPANVSSSDETIKAPLPTIDDAPVYDRIKELSRILKDEHGIDWLNSASPEVVRGWIEEQLNRPV